MKVTYDYERYITPIFSHNTSYRAWDTSDMIDMWMWICITMKSFKMCCVRHIQWMMVFLSIQVILSTFDIKYRDVSLHHSSGRNWIRWIYLLYGLTLLSSFVGTYSSKAVLIKLSTYHDETVELTCVNNGKACSHLYSSSSPFIRLIEKLTKIDVRMFIVTICS